MAHKDPFTLDLFSNTSISSGLGLGVAAFPTTLEADDTDHPQSSLVLAPARSFASVPSKAARPMGENFHLADNRELAKTWRDRARDNLAAIRLAAEIEAEQRPATADEQTALIRFTGFGASELANGVFRRPGEEAFRKGWEAIGGELEGLVDAAAYASLARCTQYAHYTPEYIVRVVWAGVQRLGFRGGRVLEPGIGSGLFPALMPAALREVCHVTGVELDPVTVRIAKLLQPRATILNQDFARAELKLHFLISRSAIRPSPIAPCAATVPFARSACACTTILS
jgi:adenine-specific DNA methylase